MTRWLPVAATALLQCAACGAGPLARSGRRLVVVCGDAGNGYYADSTHRHVCLRTAQASNGPVERSREMSMTTTQEPTMTTLAVRPHTEPDTAALIAQADQKAIVAWIGSGDLAGLKGEELKSLYLATCLSLGLNPLTRPFDLILTAPREQGQTGKLVLYPNKGAAEQLRAHHRISTRVVKRELHTELGIYEVIVRAWMPDGRSVEQSGIVAISGESAKGSYTLSGQRLADRLMVAETKALRRATLALVGLGGLSGADAEESIPLSVDWERGEIRPQVSESAAAVSAANSIGLGEPTAATPESRPLTGGAATAPGAADLRRVAAAGTGANGDVAGSIDSNGVASGLRCRICGAGLHPAVAIADGNHGHLCPRHRDHVGAGAAAPAVAAVAGVPATVLSREVVVAADGCAEEAPSSATRPGVAWAGLYDQAQALELNPPRLPDDVDAELVERYEWTLRGLVNAAQRAHLAQIPLQPLLDDADPSEMEDWRLAMEDRLQQTPRPVTGRRR